MQEILLVTAQRLSTKMSDILLSNYLYFYIYCFLGKLLSISLFDKNFFCKLIKCDTTKR